MKLDQLDKVDDYEWTVPESYRKDMRVPVRIFATREILEDIKDDKSLEQAVNAATLPGLVGHVTVMPDMHQGYGFPIGGVAATRYPDGVVSPGAIGYDINCGVRLLSSSITYEAADEHLDDLANALEYRCPSGVGVSGEIELSRSEIKRVAEEGAEFADRRGLAEEEDLVRTEAGGRIDGADASVIGNRANERGRTQVGTLGSGNHFLEVEVVDEIYHEEAAGRMGLREGCLTVMVHTGSRGYGHQICTDFVDQFQEVMHDYGIEIPDRQLVCAPMDTPEGQSYLKAMRCAANFAFANRQVLTDLTRLAFDETLKNEVRDSDLRQVYDIAHNMGKIEEHVIDGRETEVCVHRKGATRAFGPGSEEVCEPYRDLGQPVIIPGSMGTASWVLLGTEQSMARSFGSTAHGAGRTKSRRQAKKDVWGESLADELEESGVRVRAKSYSGLAEEAPSAYKDVDSVIESVENAHIAEPVARLVPVAVVKG